MKEKDDLKAEIEKELDRITALAETLLNVGDPSKLKADTLINLVSIMQESLEKISSLIKESLNG